MARATISKSKQKKAYTNAADIITITGSSNKVYTKGGNDTIKITKGNSNLADGGAGNDTITVSGGNKHTLRGGYGSDRYIINSAITKSTRLTINQSDYKKKDADTLKLAKVGKNDVTYELLKGNLTIKDKNGGAITVSGWSKNKLSKIIFKNGTVSAATISKNAYTPLTLSNSKGKTKVYSGGKDVRQNFRINFSKNTDIVINSAGSAADQISFTNAGGWSNDHEDLYVQGNDLKLGNWDSNTRESVAGQVLIKDFMKSSVKKIEFSNQTYHLLTKSGTYTGSDSYSDRFMILDGRKDGAKADVGDWNITLTGLKKNDWIDLRSLPVNRQYYGLHGFQEGTDMLLKYSYSPTPDTSVLQGTLRLKNFFNANGTVNTKNGHPLVRINREFYAGGTAENTFDGLVWDRIRGGKAYGYTATERNYRRAYINAGTSKANTVDLGNLKKANSNYVWMYYAGGGKDKITAHAGDIVYGGPGDDTLKATGRMSDIHGGNGIDTIVVQGANGANLDRVNVYGDNDNDVINAYGSYLYISGGSGSDEIHLYSAEGAAEVAHNSFVSGGSGDDLIYIHNGDNHRVNANKGDDEIYLYEGNNNILRGREGNDTIEMGAGSGNKLFGNKDVSVFAGDMDTFVFGKTSTGENAIMDYEAGLDIIKFKDNINFAESSSVNDRGDVLLDLTTGGKITIVGAAGKKITFDYGNGNTITKQFG